MRNIGSTLLFVLIALVGNSCPVLDPLVTRPVLMLGNIGVMVDGILLLSLSTLLRGCCFPWHRLCGDYLGAREEVVLTL